MLTKRLSVYSLAAAVLVSGCQTTQFTQGSNLRVGPQSSTTVMERERVEQAGLHAKAERPRLDVIIPIFDPGVEDGETEVIDGVWPELRRAEAVRFAWMMKEELEETGAFASVSVMPTAEAAGDLYVLGTIDHSDGAEVSIDVEVVDARQKRWMDENFDHEVAKNHHTSQRTRDLDPYQPVFEDAAEEILDRLRARQDAELVEVQRVATVQFAANFSNEAFGRYVTEGGFWNPGLKLVGYPAPNDPMLRRIEAISVRNELFVDGMQGHYDSFVSQMDQSYLTWQEASQAETLALREREREANNARARAFLLGALAIGAAVAAGNNSQHSNTATVAAAGAVVAGIASFTQFQESFQIDEETKFHADQLKELGDSIDIEMADQVIEFEAEQVELTGTASEQFSQWRAHLLRLFEAESTPTNAL